MGSTEQMHGCRVCLIVKRDEEASPVDDGQVERALDVTGCDRKKIRCCYFPFIAFNSLARGSFHINPRFSNSKSIDL